MSIVVVWSGERPILAIGDAYQHCEDVHDGVTAWPNFGQTLHTRLWETDDWRG